MRMLAIVDWKSAKGVKGKNFNGYVEARLQVAGYVGAYNYLAEMTRESFKVGAAGILYLDKESGEPRFVNTTAELDREIKAFGLLREYWGLMVEPTASDGRWASYGGARMPPITAIVGQLDKPALLKWAAGCAVQCVEEQLSVLRDPGTSPARVAQILDGARENFRAVQAKAKDVGKVVHDAIVAKFRGESPEEVLKGDPAAVSAYRAFEGWAERVGLEPVEVESPVYHPILRYGGKLDFLGWLDPEKA